MHRIHWSTIAWWLFVVAVVVYVISNPSSSALTIRGWFFAALTFMTTLFGGA